MKLWYLNIFLMGANVTAAIACAISENAWGVFLNMLCVAFNFAVVASLKKSDKQ